LDASFVEPFYKGALMKRTLKDEIVDVINEHEAMYASEKLADNVVKMEFHKGSLWALHYIRAYIEQSAPSDLESAPTSTNTDMASEQAQICPHYYKDRLQTGEHNFEALSCCRVAGKLRHA
jgi:hypothetical protein